MNYLVCTSKDHQDLTNRPTQQLQAESAIPPNSDVGRQLAEISNQLDDHYYREETGM